MQNIKKLCIFWGVKLAGILKIIYQSFFRGMTDCKRGKNGE